MVIIDMENGDQNSKHGCLCPQDSRDLEGGNYPQDSRGGGVNNLINPPYIRHHAHWVSYSYECLSRQLFNKLQGLKIF